MSERFLKYETEVENSLVDERGVLMPGAAGGMTIIEWSDQLQTHEDADLYDTVKEMIQTGKAICVYYEGQYIYPSCVYLNTHEVTDRPGFSTSYNIVIVGARAKSIGVVDTIGCSFLISKVV